MKITVIVPARNLERELTACLDSVAAQDFDKKDYEIIVILDSCTDNTEGTVNSWQKLNSEVNLKVLHCQCGTPGGARNIGLNNARSEYIMFIDGDDYLINNTAMTLLYACVQGHNAVRMTDHEISGNHVKFSNRLTLWLHFFSRELIGEERFTDMLLNEDYEFVRRVRSKAEYDEAELTVPLYRYNYNEEKMLNRIRAVRKASIERREQGLPPLYISDDFPGEGIFREKNN